MREIVRVAMLLNRLYMVNFKRFRNEEVIFREGITGIVGNNGSGKSSMMEAILFGLYGIRQSPLNSNYIVSASAGEKEKCTVILEFTVDGVPYRVTRSFRKTASTIEHQAQLAMGDSLLADGVSNVEREIKRIIGTGPIDFQNTIYSGQRDLLAILDERRGEREKWFMQILGIADLKKESDQAIAEEIRRDEERLRIIRHDLENADPAALAAEIEEETRRYHEAVREHSGLKEQLSSLRSRMEALDEEEQRLNGEYEEMIRLQSRVQSYMREKEEKARRIAALEGDLARLYKFRDEAEALREGESRYEELAEILEDLNEKRSRYEKISAGISAGERLIDHLSRQKAGVISQIAALDDDRRRLAGLEPVVERRRRAEADLEVVREKEERVLPRLEELKRLEWREKELEKKADVVREEIAELEERGAGREEVATIRAERDLCISVREEASGALSRVRARLDQRQKQIREARQRAEEIRTAGPDGKCPTCSRPLGDMYSRILKEIEDEIGRLESTIRRDEEEAAALSARIDESVSRLERVEERLHRAERAAQQLEEAYGRRSELMKEMVVCLEEQEKIRADIVAAGYEPGKKDALERVIKETESDWREYLACRERLKQEEKFREELKVLDERLEKEHAEITRMAGELEALGFNEQEYGSVKDELSSLEGLHNRFVELREALRDIPRLEGERESLQQRIREIDRSIAGLDEKLQAFGPLKERLEELRRDRKRVRREIDECSDMCHLRELVIQSTESRIGELEEERRKIGALQKERRALEERLSLEKTLRRIISDFMSYLLQVVREQIEEDVSSILSDITDGRYNRVILDEDFTPLVADMGEFYPIQRFSGGEQDVIAVALRIALSRFLSRLHGTDDPMFLIFDEIFGSQDEQRRMNLTRALRTQEKIFPQIILISHVSDLHGEFSHTLMVERTGEFESRIREVGV
ncbi:MAG: AAA family ATPase [Methanoculleaceae archaeon]